MVLLCLSLACTTPDEQDVGLDGTTSTPDSDEPDTPPAYDTSGGTDSDPPDSDPPVDTALGAGPAVILLVGDGMGFEHVAGGALYAHGAVGTLFMESAPTQGRLKTASLSGFTDSAAAATTLASGTKAYNGVLGQDKHGDDLETVVDLARERGFATGVVTSDQLTGATPSAFLVHTESRNDSSEIASQIVADAPDVLLGGGRSTLLEPLESAGFEVMQTREELAAHDGRLPIYGLFAEYTLDFVAEATDEEPTLAELVTAAIDALEHDEDGLLLVVESARIDHASHSNYTEAVHPETASFDEVIRTVVQWTEGWEREVNVLVTADHECGGLQVEPGSEAGELPESTWRWGDHTNADVPVFGWGTAAEVLHGQRVDNSWVHAALAAAITGEAFVEPTVPRLADGDLDDLGDKVTTQTQETDYGAGYNQLDGLRVTSDVDALWIGLDGVFDDEANGVLVWIDLDHGAGTGVGADKTLDDSDAPLDILASALGFELEVDGLGFDAVVGTLEGTMAQLGNRDDEAGLRLLHGSYGTETDLYWAETVANFDDGNVARNRVAEDAGETGATDGGLELQLPWSELLPDGLAETQTLALWAVLVNEDGTAASNQALPAWTSAAAPDIGSLAVSQVVTITVDAAGTVTAGPEVSD